MTHNTYVPKLFGQNFLHSSNGFAETVPGSHVTFVSNNAYEWVSISICIADLSSRSHMTFEPFLSYLPTSHHSRNTPESLGECFERNAKGMLKTMAIHELALLVSFYNVNVENIKSFISCYYLNTNNNTPTSAYSLITKIIKFLAGIPQCKPRQRKAVCWYSNSQNVLFLKYFSLLWNLVPWYEHISFTWKCKSHVVQRSFWKFVIILFCHLFVFRKATKDNIKFTKLYQCSQTNIWLSRNFRLQHSDIRRHRRFLGLFSHTHC